MMEPPAWSRTATGYTQIELNFPLFFGMSIMMYEATLISDDSPFDRNQLTDAQKRGKEVFEGKGKCIACHDGPLLSKAAGVGPDVIGDKLVERMLMKDGQAAIYDDGFYNIGVRPTAEDIGLGGTDPYGVPLSFTKQWVTGQRVDKFKVEPCKFEVPFPGQDQAGCGEDVLPGGIDLQSQRIAVDGAFKTPILRNIALTPPYFHNGGQSSLAQVVAFYNRGGDFSNPEKDPDVTRLGLTQTEQDNLVAFMQSLTDDRVRCSRAPFDHPELLVPDGHKPGVVKKDGRLADKLRVLTSYRCRRQCFRLMPCQCRRSVRDCEEHQRAAAEAVILGTGVGRFRSWRGLGPAYSMIEGRSPDESEDDGNLNTHADLALGQYLYPCNSAKSSSQNSSVPRRCVGWSGCCSRRRSSTRRILPDIVFGRSANSMRRMRL